ncbi:hypothetical protein FRB99_003305 [Tulasnella sp. 403]|nr:hypothetical protein FRB99_003305 [Tulasnella sp. 403]
MIFAYHQYWSEEVCRMWYRFSPGLCVFSVAFAEYIQPPAPLGGCIPIVKSAIGIAFYIAPLVTDTVIFALTVYKTTQYLRNNSRAALPRIVLRDGIAYFILIVLVNLTNVFICLFGSMDIRALGSTFSQAITTVLISRIQLSILGKSIAIPSQRAHTNLTVLTPLEPDFPPIAPPPKYNCSDFAQMFDAPPIMPSLPSAMVHELGPIAYRNRWGVTETLTPRRKDLHPDAGPIPLREMRGLDGPPNEEKGAEESVSGSYGYEGESPLWNVAFGRHVPIAGVDFRTLDIR